LRRFLASCAVAGAAEQADRLREAAGLLGLDTWSEEGRVFEAMLNCGAYESAGLVLLGGSTPFILSRGGPGTCLASTMLAHNSEEVVVESATLALALVAAHVTAILAEIDQGLGQSPESGLAGTRIH